VRGRLGGGRLVVAPRNRPAATERAEVLASGLRGIARDASGGPLAGWSVLLEGTEAKAPERPRVRNLLSDSYSVPVFGAPGRRTQSTGPDGAFVFADVPVGTCRVWLQDAEATAVDVVLAPAEQREIELRLPEARCAVLCSVTKNGVAAVWTKLGVVCDGDSDEQDLRTDGHGAVRCLLPAGAFRLRAYADNGDVKRDRRYVLGERPLLIPAGAGTMRCTIDLEVPTLAVLAETDDGRPIAGLTVHVHGSSRRAEELSFHAESSDGRCAFVDLVPGHWTVAVSSPHLQELAPQQIEIEPGQRAVELRCIGRRAGVVRLVLRHADGSRYQRALPVDAELDYLSASWNRDRLLRCIDAERAYSATKLALAGVPLGDGVVQWSDQEVDGALVFLPFEPPPPCHVQVRDDDRNELLVVVEPRALVELVGCESSGRELTRGTVRVFAGARAVRSLSTPRATRWRSFLPPGQYRVCIDHDAGTSERFVSVQRRDVHLRLRR
jgi:hypothetical protein